MVQHALKTWLALVVQLALCLKTCRAGLGGSACTEDQAGFGGSACTEDMAGFGGSACTEDM